MKLPRLILCLVLCVLSACTSRLRWHCRLTPDIDFTTDGKHARPVYGLRLQCIQDAAPSPIPPSRSDPLTGK